MNSNTPNATSETNGQSQRRPSSNLTELLQNANGSNPSSPMNSRQNSVFVRSQQNSFECRADEEITNPDPKLIDELFSSGPKISQNGSAMEENGNGLNGSDKKLNDESKR